MRWMPWLPGRAADAPAARLPGRAHASALASTPPFARLISYAIYNIVFNIRYILQYIANVSASSPIYSQSCTILYGGWRLDSVDGWAAPGSC